MTKDDMVFHSFIAFLTPDYSKHTVTG